VSALSQHPNFRIPAPFHGSMVTTSGHGDSKKRSYTTPTLNANQAAAVDHGRHQLQEQQHVHGHGAGHSHHHFELRKGKVPWSVAVASGLVNAIIAICFCSVYGYFFFYQVYELHRVGVRMCLISCAVTGLCMAFNPQTQPFQIGGADITPVTMLAYSADRILKAIVPRLDENTSSSAAASATSAHRRALGGAPTILPHERDQYWATLMMVISLTTLIFALLFFVLGKLRVASVAEFFPAAIHKGFLTCIALKVFYYANKKVCKYQAPQFILATAIGFFLWFAIQYVPAKKLGAWKQPVFQLLFLGVPVAAFWLYTGLSNDRDLGHHALQQDAKWPWFFHDTSYYSHGTTSHSAHGNSTNSTTSTSTHHLLRELAAASSTSATSSTDDTSTSGVYKYSPFDRMTWFGNTNVLWLSFRYWAHNNEETTGRSTVEQGSFEQLEYVFKESVQWSTVAEELKALLSLFVIGTLDVVMQYGALKQHLGQTDAKIDCNTEIKNLWLPNGINGIFGGVVGYGLLESGVLNVQISGSIKDRRPALIYALTLFAVLFLTGLGFIDYLPRFFYAAILLNAGVGLLMENFIFALPQAEPEECAELLLTVIVFLTLDMNLGLAVVAGLLVAMLDFLMRSSRMPGARMVTTGEFAASRDWRGVLEMQALQHLGSRNVLVIRLTGYMFFGSVSNVVEMVKHMLRMNDLHCGKEDQEDGAGEDVSYKQTRYLVLDFDTVRGLDVSAGARLQDFVFKLERGHLLGGNKVEVIFAGVSPETEDFLKRRGVLSDCDVFRDLHMALAYTEDCTAHAYTEAQTHLLQLLPELAPIRHLYTSRRSADPFLPYFPDVVARLGMHEYFQVVEFEKGAVIGNPHVLGTHMYVIDAGQVGQYMNLEVLSTHDKQKFNLSIAPHAVLTHAHICCFTNPPRDYHVCLTGVRCYAMSFADFDKMQYERPYMYQCLQDGVMMQRNHALSRMHCDLSFEVRSFARISPKKDLTRPRLLRKACEILTGTGKVLAVDVPSGWKKAARASMLGTTPAFQKSFWEGAEVAGEVELVGGGDKSLTSSGKNDDGSGLRQRPKRSGLDLGTSVGGAGRVDEGGKTHGKRSEGNTKRLGHAEQLVNQYYYGNPGLLQENRNQEDKLLFEFKIALALEKLGVYENCEDEDYLRTRRAEMGNRLSLPEDMHEEVVRAFDTVLHRERLIDHELGITAVADGEKIRRRFLPDVLREAGIFHFRCCGVGIAKAENKNRNTTSSTSEVDLLGPQFVSVVDAAEKLEQFGDLEDDWLDLAFVLDAAHKCWMWPLPEGMESAMISMLENVPKKASNNGFLPASLIEFFAIRLHLKISPAKFNRVIEVFDETHDGALQVHEVLRLFSHIAADYYPAYKLLLAWRALAVHCGRPEYAATSDQHDQLHHMISDVADRHQEVPLLTASANSTSASVPVHHQHLSPAALRNRFTHLPAVDIRKMVWTLSLDLSGDGSLLFTDFVAATRICFREPVIAPRVLREVWRRRGQNRAAHAHAHAIGEGHLPEGAGHHDLDVNKHGNLMKMGDRAIELAGVGVEVVHGGTTPAQREDSKEEDNTPIGQVKDGLVQEQSIDV